jgi:hypothetical protein
LSVDRYFSQVRALLGACAVASTWTMTDEQRTASTGFLRARVEFIDDSVLHIREYLDLDAAESRLMYSYTYLDAQGNLRFRYDNTDHHRRLQLSTHPHHKHAGNENTIVASAAPMLAAVLAEVELMVRI